MIHFAYGSNMSRALMRRHAPAAQPAGIARLPGYRFIITRDGYASVEPAAGQEVYGLLWRLTARDRVTLDAWENVAAGLYRAEWLPVQTVIGRRSALVYVGRPGPLGEAKPGYMEVVVAAARDWAVPDRYLGLLRRWMPADGNENPAVFKGPSQKFGQFG